MSGRDPQLPSYGEGYTPEMLRAVFTGRERELVLLDEMLHRSGGSPAYLVGTRGVGKTALCRAYLDSRGSNYTGWVYCSAPRFASPDALVDYVEYQRDQLSARPSLPPQEGRDSRALLVVDDIDRFTEPEAAYLLTLLHSRSAHFVMLCTSRERFSFLERSEIPSFELTLGSLNESDVEAFLEKYVAAGSDSRARVEQFLAAVHSEGLRMKDLTPRIVLELFYSHRSHGNLRRSLAELAARGIGASNIVILEHEGRLRALPVFQGPTAGIIGPSQPPLYAAPYVVIPHLGVIWRGQLEEFEGLLADARSNERTFQSFFETNPHFLQGIEYDRVLAHPSLIREDGGSLIPDFMLQPLGSNYANILDLKRPDAKLITRRKDRRHFTQGVHEAIAQVREYREYFERSEYRPAVQERYGLTAYRPSTLIVIGRQPESVTEEELKRIACDAPAFVQVQTYDDVLRKMRRMVELKESHG